MKAFTWAVWPVERYESPLKRHASHAGDLHRVGSPIWSLPASWVGPELTNTRTGRRLVGTRTRRQTGPEVTDEATQAAVEDRARQAHAYLQGPDGEPSPLALLLVWLDLLQMSFVVLTTWRRRPGGGVTACGWRAERPARALTGLGTGLAAAVVAVAVLDCTPPGFGPTGAAVAFALSIPFMSLLVPAMLGAALLPPARFPRRPSSARCRGPPDPRCASARLRATAATNGSAWFIGRATTDSDSTPDPLPFSRMVVCRPPARRDVRRPGCVQPGRPASGTQLARPCPPGRRSPRRPCGRGRSPAGRGSRSSSAPTVRRSPCRR